MHQNEIEIQKALGTLSIEEWFLSKGISRKRNWWYFPLSEKLAKKCSRKEYVVHNLYLNQFRANLPHLTNEDAADVIIKSVYECIAAEGVDH